MAYTEEMREEVVWPVSWEVQKPLRTQLGGRVRYSIWESNEKEAWLCKTSESPLI